MKPWLMAAVVLAAGAVHGAVQAATTTGTARVGSYLANGWGLYDLHGNLLEWCLDWHAAYPGTTVDPVGAASGWGRIQRGGGWGSYAKDCRSADRRNHTPTHRHYGYGFRVAMTLP